MIKSFKIIFVVFVIFFVFKITLGAGFSGKTELNQGINCNSRGTVFNLKNNLSKYSYPFFSTNTSIKNNKIVLGNYKKIDSNTCSDDDGNPVTVYIVDKIGVSR